LSDNTDDEILIIYDGQCPLCTAYVRMQRLKALAGRIRLIDARSGHPVVAEIRRAGLDLDEGMAMKLGGELLHGAEVINRLALLTGPSGLVNRLWYWVFRSPARARLLYPGMRAVRNLVLGLLGRSRINP